MMNGKRVQNFITYQTKQTIYLNKNLPELIVHEQTIETDSFKELLTKRSQKCKSVSKNTSKQKNINDMKNQFKKDKQNFQQNYSYSKLKMFPKSNFHNESSNSKSNKKHKESNLQSKHNLQKSSQNTRSFHLDQKMNTKRQKKQFCTDNLFVNQHSKSNKSKLNNKKTKSMIRLPKYDEKNANNNIDHSKKILRKSFSPNRNYSQGIKKSSNPTPHNSNQYIKTTKFTTQIKDGYNDKKIKKAKQQQKSKQKLKKNIKSSKANLNQLLNNLNPTNMQKNQLKYTKKDEDKQKQKDIDKKVKKKISPDKKKSPNKNKQKQKFQQQQQNINPKVSKKKTSTMKKRKILGKTKIHFQSVEDQLLRRDLNNSSPQTIQMDKYLSNRDSLTKRVFTDRDSLKISERNKKNVKKQVVLSSKDIKRLKNDAAIKIQKVYKGYITRKCLRQYMKIINAAVTIQKYWRGFKCRKNNRSLIKKLKERKSQNSIISRKDQKQLHYKQNSFQQTDVQNFDKWKDILMEVMGQQSVNQHLKSKIKTFLDKEEISARSSLVSRKSRNSQEKLKQQMLSQKRYFQKQFLKKQQPNQINQGKSFDQLMPVSPSFDIAANKQKLFSPARKNKIQSKNIEQMTFSPKLQKKKINRQPIKSPEQVVMNLYQIQEYQRQKLIDEASAKKIKLNSLKQSQLVSPKTYQIKQNEIQSNLNKKLQQFELSIKQVIQNCKQKKKPVNIQNQLIKHQNLQFEITPQRSYLKQDEGLPSQQIISKPLQPYIKEGMIQNESNLQMSDPFYITENKKDSIKIQSQPAFYQKFQTFNINALSSQRSYQQQQQITSQPFKKKYKKIDPSYNFIDQYLLTLIQFLRTNGQAMIQVVRGIKCYRNLSPYVILRNLSTVKENGQNDDEDDAFSLPLYKYLEEDNQIIKEKYVREFNKYFQRMQNKDSEFYQPMQSKGQQNNMNKQLYHNQSPILLSPSSSHHSPRITTPQSRQLYQHYLKLLIDSFIQALNLKRPCHYIFTNYAIQSFNSHHIISRQQYDIQQQYDMYCASSMQDVFVWFNVKYGYSINLNNIKKNNQDQLIDNNQQLQQEDKQSQSLRENNINSLTVDQIVFLNKNSLEKIVKMEVDKKWDQYYQMIQVIAKLSQQIFQDFLIRQAFTILNIEKKFIQQAELIG